MPPIGHPRTRFLPRGLAWGRTDRRTHSSAATLHLGTLPPPAKPFPSEAGAKPIMERELGTHERELNWVDFQLHPARAERQPGNCHPSSSSLAFKREDCLAVSNILDCCRVIECWKIEASGGDLCLLDHHCVRPSSAAAGSSVGDFATDSGYRNRSPYWRKACTRGNGLVALILRPVELDSWETFNDRQLRRRHHSHMRNACSAPTGRQGSRRPARPPSSLPPESDLSWMLYSLVRFTVPI